MTWALIGSVNHLTKALHINQLQLGQIGVKCEGGKQCGDVLVQRPRLNRAFETIILGHKKRGKWGA